MADIAPKVHELVLASVPDEPARSDVVSNPLWAKVRATGTELWLDTGDIDEIAALWTSEFTALTTNNTLLNKEVQKGIYDDLIARVAEALRGDVPEGQIVLEIAFVLNAVHGLRLRRRFGAMVSVELHTDLSYDPDRAEAYGVRYHALCPDGFYMKVPLTAAGLITARRLSERGIGVNLTLGFSARQNALITHVARPAFCNVFLGRLGSVVADNGLGSGENVGAKATLASQRAVRAANADCGAGTRQIAASMRDAAQVAALLGVDVHTIPPNCARAYMESNPDDASIAPQTDNDPEPGIDDGVDRKAAGLTTLWSVPDPLVETVAMLGAKDVVNLTPQDIETVLAVRGFGDLMPRWSAADRQLADADGKIPILDHWRNRLRIREIGLDALMNLSGLRSFTADQAAMDARIRSMIG